MLVYNLALHVIKPFVDQKRKKFNFPKRSVWFHCASIGELSAILPIVERISSKWITTTSKNGLQKIYSLNFEGSLLPLDFENYMEAALSQVDPKIVVFSENDFWPNFYKIIKRKGLPYLILNLRIHKINLLNKLWVNFKKDFFKHSQLIVCQNDFTARILNDLGVANSTIMVSPNLKLGVQPKLNKNAENLIQEVKAKFEKIITLASLRLEECEVLFPILEKLLKKFTDLAVIIIPRYLEQVKAIQSKVLKYLNECKTYPSFGRIIIINQFGLVPSFVKHSFFYIIGGTFCKHVGGHNPIEGAHFGVVGVAGPETYKIDDLDELFIKVRDKNQLETMLYELLKNPSRIKEYQKKLFDKVKEVSNRIEYLVDFLKSYDSGS